MYLGSSFDVTEIEIRGPSLIDDVCISSRAVGGCMFVTWKDEDSLCLFGGASLGCE